MKRNGCLTTGILCLTALICLFHSSTVWAKPFQLVLDDHWVMKTGDDPAWAAMDLDVSTWKPIKTGVAWENPGIFRVNKEPAHCTLMPFDSARRRRWSILAKNWP